MEKQIEFRDVVMQKIGEFDDEISRINKVFSSLKDNYNNFQTNSENRLVAVEKRSQQNKMNVDKFKITIDERNNLIQKLVKEMEKLEETKAKEADHL